MSASSSLGACGALGWPRVPNGAFQGDVRIIKKNIEKSYMVQIAKSTVSTSCRDEELWEIRDPKTDLLLARVPLSSRGDGELPDAREFRARMAHVLRTPKRELVALARARRQFFDDANSVNQDMGVYFTHPAEGEKEQSWVRDGKARLIASMMTCKDPGWGENIRSLVHVDESVEVGLIYYDPRQLRYNSDVIYREGQLRARLVKQPAALRKLSDMAQENVTVCGSRGAPGGKSWQELAERFSALAGPSAPPRPLAHPKAPSDAGVD